MIAPWAAQYVGIPYADKGRDRSGCDCWGLLRLVLGEVFRISLPSYTEDYATAADFKEVSALIAGEIPHMPWRRVDGEPRAGHCVLFRLEGVPMHVGVMVSPTMFLHTRQGVAAAIDRLDAPLWHRKRLGIYEWTG